MYRAGSAAAFDGIVGLVDGGVNRHSAVRRCRTDRVGVPVPGAGHNKAEHDDRRFKQNSGLSRRQAAMADTRARPSITPRISDSFRINRSSPSMITSVPAHLPNSTRSPTLTPSGHRFPLSSVNPGPDGEHLAFHRLLLGRVGNDDASGRLLLDLHPLQQHAIVTMAGSDGPFSVPSLRQA